MNVTDRTQEYLDTRSPGELDLYSVVVNEFHQSGLINKTPILTEYFEKNQLMDKKPNVQRFFLNKFFTTQLLMTTVNSSECRYCLINDGTIDDWIRLFKSKILPFLIENNLPIRI
jgi:hypothetical protein